MKKYQVKINNMELEIIQDDDGKFITPYLCIEDWGKFGTTLKPSFEPIIVARKPFKGSLVDNVIEYGVGGINIDECRVETNEKMKPCKRGSGVFSETSNGIITGWNKDDYNGDYSPNNLGRFPANTILTYDETDFDEVCGGFPNTKTGWKNTDVTKSKENINVDFGVKIGMTGNHYEDSGSASRYFYCAKASAKDRNEGLDVEIEEYVLKEDTPDYIRKKIEEIYAS